MKLAEFRAQYPGLYDEAFAAGQAAEFERVTQHLDMGRAISNEMVADRGIRSGHSLRDWLNRYAEAAGGSDEQSKAFVKARDAALGRSSSSAHAAPATTSSSSAAAPATPAPRTIVHVSHTSDGRDIGDAVADMFDAARGGTVVAP